MNKTHQYNLNPRALASFACGVFALVTTLAPGVANAQNSFNIQVGESDRYQQAQLQHSRGEIDDARLHDILREESCVNPVARYQNRNRFSIMVENTSSTNELTSFSIDIQELDFIWGDGDMTVDGFNGLFAMDTGRSDPGVTFTATPSADKSELTVDFTGLTAGKAAILRVDLDPSATNTSGMLYPNFGEAILGDGGRTPAFVDIGFAVGEQFPDQQFMAGIYVGPTNTTLEPYHAQTPAFNFGLTGTGVPEPTSAALLLAGIAGLMSLRRRK